MTPDDLDAHARPPSSLRALFKKWQKYSPECLTDTQEILDTITLDQSSVVKEVFMSDESLANIREGVQNFSPECSTLLQNSKARCFEIKSLPGAELSHP